MTTEIRIDSKGRTLKCFVRTVPISPLAREAALFALRMIDGRRWHRKLLDSEGGIRDRDVFALMGLDPNDQYQQKITVDKIRIVISAQKRRLETHIGTRQDRLAENIAKLGDILKLNSTERAVLRLAVIATRVKYFPDLLTITLSTWADLVRGVACAIGRHSREVEAALAQNQKLHRSGFFENSLLRAREVNPLEMQSAVVDALLAHPFDEERFLRRLVRQGVPSMLSMTDFVHLAGLDLIQRYLTDVAKRRRKGVNLLLYGLSGTGKTEFVRTLAPSLALELYEVPNEDADGDPISGRQRFGAYTVCQHLLGSRRRQLLLFDEVEDVFGSGGSALGSMFGIIGAKRAPDPDNLRKSWVNETLESNPVPAIWVCNSIDAIDPAFLRRFDLVVEFGMPRRNVRRRMLDRHFRAGEISPACAERLASIECLPPAQVERAARVVRSLRSRNIDTRDSEVERILTASLRAMGHRKAITVPPLPGHYDPAFLNSDYDLKRIANGLSRNANARICLYGPPGTGKTAFGQHLGRVLDCQIMIKRGSDLLSMWAGATEANIAKAFAQAGEENAILMIDEADGFLRDRTIAQLGWEVTQVNELLTQMEAFQGIFIASTNLIDLLDAASLRRFDFKVKFDYLTCEQRRLFLHRVACDAADASASMKDALAHLDRQAHLTPGDFANVLRQVQITGDAPTALRLVRLLAQEGAMKPDGRRR